MIEIIKRNKFIYNLLLFIFFIPRTLYYYVLLMIFSLFKIDNKKIVVISYNGKGYWDNGKYICNELLKYDYKIYWATTKKYKNSLPPKINYVKIDSIKYLYHLATAKIWINNNRFRLGIRKRKNQFYIQTRHGCIWFKKVEAAVKNTSMLYVWSAKNDSKMANLILSNSTFMTNIYKKYFWYNGNILEYWCPRNDIIINNSKVLIRKVRQFFWFSDLEKICLYAPTFRDNNSLNAYNIDYEILIDELKRKFWWKWKLLIRLHPAISGLTAQLTGFNKNILNATDYPDMQELLVATDFMITDYSSCIFDYAISWKPAVIYASDIEEYRENRDFFVKLEDIPFPIATNNTELEKVINNFNFDQYKEKLDNYYENMWLKETGKSCEKIAEIINKITKEMAIKNSLTFYLF